MGHELWRLARQRVLHLAGIVSTADGSATAMRSVFHQIGERSRDQAILRLHRSRCLPKPPDPYTRGPDAGQRV